MNYNELFFGTWGDLFGDGTVTMVQASWAVSSPMNQAGSLHVIAIDASGVRPLGITTIEGTSNPVIGDFANTGHAQILVPGFLDSPNNVAPSYLVGFDATSHAFTKTMLGNPICSHTSFVGDYNGDGSTSLLAITYLDSSGTRQPLLFSADGSGGVAVKGIGLPAQTGSSIAFADFDKNGKIDVITGDTQNGNVAPTIGMLNDHGAWLFEQQCNGTWKPTELPPPYFYASAFDGTDSIFQPGPQQTAAEVRTHQVAIRVLDVNRDGRDDIVIASGIWSNVTPFGVLQFLIQQPDGSFKDETATRLYGYDLRRQSAHQVWFEDINGDGYPDLLLSDNSLPEIGTNAVAGVSCTTQGNEVLVNDGEGHFVSVMKDGFCKWAPNSVYVQKFNPYVDHATGVFGFVEIEPTNQPGNNLYVYSWSRVRGRLSTGPGFIDPASCGAAGFNEWYYLLHYADARAAVMAGQYSSGLAFYLAVGQSRGDKPHAN